MKENSNTELIAMQLITFSGEARSLAFEALANAKENLIVQAKEQIKQAETKLLQAHKIQTSLLQMEALDGEVKINVLLIHAQDHLMTSALAIELIKEMIVLHDQKMDKE